MRLNLKTPNNIIHWQYILLFVMCCSLSACSSIFSDAEADETFKLSKIIPKVEQRYGPQATPVVRHWDEALQRIQPESELAKLREINDYFNNLLIFTSDIDAWGLKDYWATPVEALLRRRADCEDYTIAKYFSLKYLGVPTSKMRLIYVSANGFGYQPQKHMVLAYYPKPNADPWVLDNLVKDIRKASQRRDLTPVFSFNSDGVWPQGSQMPRPGGNRLSLWRNLISKMKQEGFE